MPLYKRGNIWWVRFTDPNGQEIRRTARTKNKREAQEYHDRLKASLWRESQLGERPRRKWEDAVERWFEEKTEKATLHDGRSHLRWLHPYLVDRYLEEISKELVDSIRHARKGEGVTNATVNRTLEVLRGIFGWPWIWSGWTTFPRSRCYVSHRSECAG